MLERLELGTDLFRVIEDAQAWTKHRFDELHENNTGRGRTEAKGPSRFPTIPVARSPLGLSSRPGSR
jgi:hypothetical protein